jgi:hypothetical protein
MWLRTRDRAGKPGQGKAFGVSRQKLASYEVPHAGLCHVAGPCDRRMPFIAARKQICLARDHPVTGASVATSNRLSLMPRLRLVDVPCTVILGL